MADRKGEMYGYNIPEVTACPSATEWLSDEGGLKLAGIKDDKCLPEHARRLLCDAYMCFYKSNEVMMYK